MTLVLFTWYILLHISDTPVCALWLSTIPTQADVQAACRGYDLGALSMRVSTLETRQTVCDTKAEWIFQVNEICGYTLPPDQYVIHLIQPARDVISCAVNVDHEGKPTRDEILASCGPSAWFGLASGRAELIYSHQTTENPDPPMCQSPDVPIGPGLYDQPSDPKQLWSDDQLTWLAGRLIWFGVVIPDCGGYSGLDPETLAANACGLRSARGKVIEWQNQFDTDIYNAAVMYNVPARLLKRMIGQESQFWPLYVGAAGEIGILQVTENGADVLLRYDPTLMPWYGGVRVDAQFWLRMEQLNKFDCINCDLSQAIEHTRAMIPMYARLLAAYRCRAVSINPALTGAQAWQQAAVDFNGSGEYLRHIEN